MRATTEQWPWCTCVVRLSGRTRFLPARQGGTEWALRACATCSGGRTSLTERRPRRAPKARVSGASMEVPEYQPLTERRPPSSNVGEGGREVRQVSDRSAGRTPTPRR